MNILITGITGFFGKSFCHYLSTRDNYTIIGTAHSEHKLAHFKKSNPQVKVYVIDLASERIESELTHIVNDHQIDYIIHAAAMKHVDICQDHPLMAHQVNAVASDILMKVAKRHKVKNVIGLSTDKANNPCNTYGMVKYIMQESLLANNYSVYQGANFFWSDGSVLDIWFNQYIRSKPLTLRNANHVRYFNTIYHVCDKIYHHLNATKTIILPDYVYVICLNDLLEAFKEYFNYHHVESTPAYHYEKQVELVKEGIQKIVLDKFQIMELIDHFYQNML